MKKLFDYLCVLTILMSTTGLISAQNFTVKIEATALYQNYFKPVKAGGSFQFQIRVTNNRPDACTVSIKKNAMGVVSSWVSIANNSQTISPGKSKNFSLTINVPASTCNCDFTMFLRFDAYDQNGGNHPFTYDDQYIIVDNSAPEFVSFTVSQKSTTVTINSWSSWDARSSFYTGINSSSGYKGIKSYTLVLKNPNGTIKASKSIDATSTASSHKFTGLVSNTNYRASVKAIDLVGNSKTVEKSATTAPAKPSGLVFSNTTYISTKLSWNTSAGATGYNVYIVNSNGTYSKRNSSPITGNSFTINGLDPSTPYKFNAIALSNAGTSDRSANAPVTTLALPPIIGPSIMCSGTYTYMVQNLVTGYTVFWNSSSNLYKQSSSNSSAVFIGSGNGAGWVDASIKAPNGQVLGLSKKDVWVGKPSIKLHGKIGSCYEPIFKYKGPLISGINYSWSVNNPNINLGAYGGFCNVDAFIPDGTSQFYTLTLTISDNNCATSGTKSAVYYKPTVDDCNGGPGGPGQLFSVSPNPASSEVSISINADYKNTAFDENEQWELEIYNQSYMLQEKQSKLKGNTFRINTSSWKEGVYLIRATNKNKIVTGKMIIKR